MSVNLTTYLRLVLKLRMHGAMPPFYRLGQRYFFIFVKTLYVELN